MPSLNNCLFKVFQNYVPGDTKGNSLNLNCRFKTLTFFFGSSKCSASLDRGSSMCPITHILVIFEKKLLSFAPWVTSRGHSMAWVPFFMGSPLHRWEMTEVEYGWLALKNHVFLLLLPILPYCYSSIHLVEIVL